MIIDFDDFAEDNHRYDLLMQLRIINPAFKCTLFAVPGCGSPEFWEAVPDWCELAVHGWMHPDSYECSEWDHERMTDLLDLIDDDYPQFVRGFKAPGWQISDACYEVLLTRGWWVADQHLEDARRPANLRTYLYEDGNDRWHGHIQDVCGNGLAETWEELSVRVAAATSFSFASESAV